MGDPVLAAIITGIVAALITAPVSALIGWLQYRGVIQNIRETSIRDIRAKRIEAYSKFWSVLQKNVNDNVIEGRTRDLHWLTAFVTELNGCHAEYGVLLSQAVYSKFCEFREQLLDIYHTATQTKMVTDDDMKALDRIWSGVQQTHTLGLATYMKRELASYEKAQTRAESRVLDLRKLLRERDRLSAGGRWIRTSGSAREEIEKSWCPVGVQLILYGFARPRDRWFADSPLEGDRLEPSLPLTRTHLSRAFGGALP
jgi:hypothetical protein